MIRRPPRSTRIDPLFPFPPRFRSPVLAPSMMFPPGAAPAPIVEVAITQRIAVAVIVEHPHAIAGIIIIVVPAAAKADVDETAAIIRRDVTAVDRKSVV